MRLSQSWFFFLLVRRRLASESGVRWGRAVRACIEREGWCSVRFGFGFGIHGVWVWWCSMHD